MLPYILPPKQYDFVHSWKHRSRRDNELDQRKPGSKNFSAAKEIKRQFPEETVQEIIPESIMRMPLRDQKVFWVSKEYGETSDGRSGVATI